MNEILFLLAVSLAGSYASAKSDPQVAHPNDCSPELVALANGPDDTFLTVPALAKALDGRGRATLLVRMPVGSTSLETFEKDHWFVGSIGLTAPRSLRRIDRGMLSFVVDGGAATIRRFLTDLQTALPKAAIGVQILDSVVKDTAEIHLTSPSKYTSFDSAAVDADSEFEKTTAKLARDPDRSTMMLDRATGLDFDVFATGAVQRILDSRSLAKLASLDVTVAASELSIGQTLALFGKALKGPRAVAIRYRSVFLLNQSAAIALLELKGRMAPARPRSSVYVSSDLQSLLKDCLSKAPRGTCLDAPSPVEPAPLELLPPVVEAEPALPVTDVPVVIAPAVVAPYAEVPPPSLPEPPPGAATPVAPTPPAVLPRVLRHESIFTAERLEALGKVRATILPLLMIHEQAKALMGREENRVRQQVALLSEGLEHELASIRTVEVDYQNETDPELREILRDDHAAYLATIETYKEELIRLLGSSSFSQNDTIIVEMSRFANSMSDEFLDLENMYQRLAKRRGWQFEEIDASKDDHGLYHLILRISGNGVRALIETERGRHRFRRYQEKTDKEIAHYIDVSVYAEPNESEMRIEEKDFEITTMRSSGAGGQHVNTTDSAVRVVHKATSRPRSDCGVTKRPTKLWPSRS